MNILNFKRTSGRLKTLPDSEEIPGISDTVNRVREGIFQGAGGGCQNALNPVAQMWREGPVPKPHFLALFITHALILCSYCRPGTALARLLWAPGPGGHLVLPHLPTNHSRCSVTPLFHLAPFPGVQG